MKSEKLIDMTEKIKELPIKVGCDRGLCHQAVGRQDRQLNTYDWLADVPGNQDTTDLVEVQFKHTRKGYYHNVNNLDLKKGDIVEICRRHQAHLPHCPPDGYG